MTTTAISILSQVKIYVGTYEKYNNGSIHGEWLTLSDYSDLDDFFEACREIHKDEEDPEFMFQDFEVPGELINYISESHISKDIFQAAEVLEEIENDPIGCWNTYCSYTGRDNLIYDFNEDFFNEQFSSPAEAARAASFGKLNWTHKYIYFNGYENLESTNDPEDVIEKSDLINWMVEIGKLRWWNNKRN